MGSREPWVIVPITHHHLNELAGMSPVSFSEDHFLHSVDVSVAKVPKSLVRAERAALTILGV